MCFELTGGADFGFMVIMVNLRIVFLGDAMRDREKKWDGKGGGRE